MSSLPPSDQSLAGGIFNTVSKVGANVGLGVTTAIYNAVRNQAGSSPIKPYLATYWAAAVLSGMAVFLVPFLKLGTQGAASDENIVDAGSAQPKIET